MLREVEPKGAGPRQPRAWRKHALPYHAPGIPPGARISMKPPVPTRPDRPEDGFVPSRRGDRSHPESGFVPSRLGDRTHPGPRPIRPQPVFHGRDRPGIPPSNPGGTKPLPTAPNRGGRTHRPHRFHRRSPFHDRSSRAGPVVWICGPEGTPLTAFPARSPGLSRPPGRVGGPGLFLRIGPDRGDPPCAIRRVAPGSVVRESLDRPQGPG